MIDKKGYRIWVAVIFLLLAILQYYNVVPFHYKFEIASFWIIDYSVGFIKRGLIGSIIGFFMDYPVTMAILFKIATALLMIYVVSVLLFVMLGWNKTNADRAYTFLAIFVLLLSPYGLSFYYYDILRFDSIASLVANVYLILLIFSNRLSVSIVAGLMIVLGVVLLIHESSIFLSIPFLLMCFAIRYYGRVSHRDYFGYLFLQVFFVLLVFGLIMFFGRGHEKYSGIVELVQGRTLGWEPTIDYYEAIYTWRFDQYISYAYTSYIDRDFHRVIWSLTVIPPIAVMIYGLLDTLKRAARLDSYMFATVLVGAFSPFVMFLLADDVNRWASIAVCNACVLVFIKDRLVTTSNRKKDDNPVWGSSKRVVVFIFTIVWVMFMKFPYHTHDVRTVDYLIGIEDLEFP